MLYPLRFTPLYYVKVWGGRRLGEILGREIPADQPIGESWEIADHPHGESVVANGPDRGLTLHALIERDPDAILGTEVAARYGTRFPLLVKYIDAEDKLSVQVHPDDAYAGVHEGELGKTEMWHVLHADPGACLIAGLTPGVTREDFAHALAHDDPAQLLYRMPVHTGDSIFIPAGRIHAIMPGLLILEIQQNSDTTYRLYDWGRMGLDGTPRALHVDDAMAVTNWTDYAPKTGCVREEAEGLNLKTTLAACEYFVVEKFDLQTPRHFTNTGASCYILNCVAGEGVLQWAGGTESLVFGDSLLVPASLASFTLEPWGEASFVLSHVPSA